MASPWCAWCGERIAVGVLGRGGVVYHVRCLRRRAAVLGEGEESRLGTAESAPEVKKPR